MTGDATLDASAGPASRVQTSLPGLVAHVAVEYRLGAVADWSVLETGYEDCNLDVRAERGRMVVKVFAAGRPASVPARTAAIIVAARAVGVRHPRLYRDASGSYVHQFDGHWLIVMDHAPGQTYYEMGRPPAEADSPHRREPRAGVRPMGHRQPRPPRRAGRPPARR
jgi:Ser/Thr protein kinase RdoA (MazF antagonist)